MVAESASLRVSFCGTCEVLLNDDESSLNRDAESEGAQAWSEVGGRCQ